LACHIEAPLPYLPNEEAQAGHVGRHRNRRGTGWVRRDTSSRDRPGVLDTLQRGPWVAHLPPAPPGARFGTGQHAPPAVPVPVAGPSYSRRQGGNSREHCAPRLGPGVP
jgi:hypothetical protein